MHIWGEACGSADGRRRATAVQAGRREGSTADWGQGTRGGAHVEHAEHGRDTGGVEAQGLVERIRVLPRIERRVYGVGRGAEAMEAGGAAGDGGARSVQGRARLHVRGRARGGAHQEHVEHARDAGGVEGQRLVERPRVLPRVARRAYTVRGEGAGQQLGFNVQGRGSAADWGQGTRGGAHIEHEVHARDAGGVEAQRLVERPRVLPRVERRAYDGE